VDHLCAASIVIRAGCRHVEAPGQPLRGGLKYLKEMLFMAKYIPSSINCKYVTESCGRLALLRHKASCLSEGILTVYIEILAFLNMFFKQYASLGTRKVHFRPNNAFVLLVVLFCQ